MSGEQLDEEIPASFDRGEWTAVRVHPRVQADEARRAAPHSEASRHLVIARS